jgi:transposase, IS605 OrfB family, central region
MNKIYKTIKLPIKYLSKKNIDYLFECNRESAKVWNECIRLNKKRWEKEEKYADRKYLQDNTKGFSKFLTAKSIQMVCFKFLSAMSAIQKARKNGRTDLKYPWKFKKYTNTQWDSQNLKINYEKGIIRIPRPQKYINHKRILNPLFLKFKSESIPKNIVQVELIYNNGLKLAINYFIEEENIKINNNHNTCAIDLGEIHSITSVDTLGNSNIITGRQIRSYKRFRNKELGHLGRRLSKCKKGSRNYKKYRKAIRKLLSKTNKKVDYSLKKTAKLFSDYVIENNISIVVVGDLKQFNMNQKYNKRKKGTKQRLVQWEYGQLINLLHNNLDKHSVTIEEISERYTSQTCPSCNHRYKPTGRNYICSECGFIMHRDVVGAYNILSKYLNNGRIKHMDLDIKPVKYLRIT